MALASVNLFVVAIVGSARWSLASIALFVVALALYVRLGTPDSPTVDIGSPVDGRWKAANSPTSRVPSHHIHAWAQTYAIDLVFDADEATRPPSAWWPLARRPEDYPGFGRPVRAPVDGVMVKRIDVMRDHWSRSSLPAMAYFVLEGVRELFGPPGVMGNHLVIRGQDGTHVLLAHLKRRSIRHRRGERVHRGEIVAECGNSGNSTEPHLHLQVMDLRSPWFAAGSPMTIGGSPLPRTGEHLVASVRNSDGMAAAHRKPAEHSDS